MTVRVSWLEIDDGVAEAFVCSEAIASALRMRKPHKFHPQRLLDAAMKA